MAIQTPQYLQFQRQFAESLDSTEVHASYQDAVSYATSPTAYEGQTIKWKDDNGIYQSGVIQTDKTIKTSEFDVIIDHNELPGRDQDDAHPISAITDLQNYIDEYISLHQTEPDPEFTKLWLPKIVS